MNCEVLLPVIAVVVVVVAVVAAYLPCILVAHGCLLYHLCIRRCDDDGDHARSWSSTSSSSSSSSSSCCGEFHPLSE